MKQLIVDRGMEIAAKEMLDSMEQDLAMNQSQLATAIAGRQGYVYRYTRGIVEGAWDINYLVIEHCNKVIINHLTEIKRLKARIRLMKYIVGGDDNV